MNVTLIIAVVSLTLQFSTATAMALLGRARSWRRARWFGVIAFTAGCYGVVDAYVAITMNAQGAGAWVVRIGTLLGAFHGAAWLVFAHVDDAGQWGSLPVWVRRTVVGGLAWCLTMLSIDVARPHEIVGRLVVPSLGLDYTQVQLSVAGQLAAVAPFLLVSLSLAGYARRVRSGEPNVRAVVVGLCLLIACALEEMLVAAGLLNFMYLADFGYICAVAPVMWQWMQKIVDDAGALRVLSAHLNDDVQRRTEERDAARVVAVEQQRLAALGRLSAGIGHEINNPLQYLRFSLEEIRASASVASDPALLEALDHADDGADRIRRVVGDLRTYVRPASDDLERLDIRDVVRTALRIGTPQWRHDVELVVALEDVPAVHGHEGKLVQVVLNPLVNAAQAVLQRAAGGANTLHVTTRTGADGWAEIEIRDAGDGFAPEVLSRLGEPYVTTKAARGGTGLGLFVSRGIVESHGGTMEFGNHAHGGAVVLIRLPAGVRATAEPDVTGAADDVLVPDEAAPLHVLLVEDDAPTLTALSRGLEREGIAVHGERSVESALLWLNGHRPDLVVTDLMMPGKSGADLAQELGVRNADLRARLVVITGGASTPELARFLEDPTLLVLGKPIASQSFAQALRRRAATATTVSSFPSP